MKGLANLTAIWLYRVREPGDAQSSGFSPSTTTLPTDPCPLCGDGTAGTVPVADGMVRWVCLPHAGGMPVPMLEYGREVVQYWDEVSA